MCFPISFRMVTWGQLEVFFRSEFGRKRDDSCPSIPRRLPNFLWMLLVVGIACAGCSYERPPQRSERAILSGHSYVVWSVAFSPDGNRLATASGDTLIKLWNVRTGREEATLKGHSHQVSCVAFSPDGSILASGGSYGDNSVRLWQATSPWRCTVLPIPTEVITSLAFSRDGKTLTIGSRDKMVHLWDVAEKKERPPLKEDKEIESLAFSPYGEYLAVGTNDSLKLWDTATYRIAKTLKAEDMSYKSLAFTPDGKSLITGGSDGGRNMLICWNLETLTERWHASTHDGVIYSVAVHPSGKYVVSPGYWQASSTGLLQIWDAMEGKELVRFDAHMHDVVAIAFSPDGKILATGGGGPGGTTRLWDFDQLLR